jgi:hypothetical protein
VGKFVVMLALGLATASVANADIGKRDFGNTRAYRVFSHATTTGSTSTSTSTSTSGTGSSSTGTSAVSTPEIDPAGIMSGLTLLLGGLAVVRGRRKA